MGDWLKDVSEHGIRAARRFVEDGGETPAHFFYRQADGNTSMVMAPIFGPEHKNAIAQFMRQFIAEHNVTAYVFVTEAWTIERDRETWKEGELPSEADDRIEIITTLGVERGRFLVGTSKIDRTDGINVSEPKWTEDLEITGRFADLLPTLN